MRKIKIITKYIISSIIVFFNSFERVYLKGLISIANTLVRTFSIAIKCLSDVNENEK